MLCLCAHFQKQFQTHARVGWVCREREAAERMLEEARQAAADSQEAWRAALAERLRREAAEAEKALRAKLAKERDEEVEVRAKGGW